jgi:recombinational DNA repair protein RecT
MIIKKEDVKTFVGDNIDEITALAIRGYNKKAFIASLIMTIYETDGVRSCLASAEGRRSLYNAMMRAGSLGLSLNPQEGKACIVPYKGEAAYQIMKEGYIELILETGAVSYVKSWTVYENDTLIGPSETENGATYQFAPARKNRGTIDGCIAVAGLNDGKSIALYMNAEEIAEWKKKYSPYSRLSLREYGEKTVIKRLCRSIKLPMLKGLDEVILQEEADEEAALRNVTPHEEKGVDAEELAGKLEAESDEREARLKAEQEAAANYEANKTKKELF